MNSLVLNCTEIFWFVADLKLKQQQKPVIHHSLRDCSKPSSQKTFSAKNQLANNLGLQIILSLPQLESAVAQRMSVALP